MGLLLFEFFDDEGGDAFVIWFLRLQESNDASRIIALRSRVLVPTRDDDLPQADPAQVAQLQLTVAPPEAQTSVRVVPTRDPDLPQPDPVIIARLKFDSPTVEAHASTRLVPTRDPGLPIPDPPKVFRLR